MLYMTIIPRLLSYVKDFMNILYLFKKGGAGRNPEIGWGAQARDTKKLGASDPWRDERARGRDK
jgi:hypothetical protein